MGLHAKAMASQPTATVGASGGRLGGAGGGRLGICRRRRGAAGAVLLHALTRNLLRGGGCGLVVVEQLKTLADANGPAFVA